MELTEQAIMEAFGLESGETRPEGGNEPAPAEPETAREASPEGQEASAGEQDAPGGNEPEPAEPADERGVDDSDMPGEPGEPGVSPERQTAKPPQTPEENRRFAAQRRKAEQEAAMEAARQEAREAARRAATEEMDLLIRDAGLRNPYSNTPITTMEELRAYREQHRAAQLQRELAAGKLTPETLHTVINDALNAREQANKQEAPAEQEPAGGQPHQDRSGAPDDMPDQPPVSQAVQARIDAEVAEIGRMDPAVKTMADLLTQPWSKAFYGYVREGYSFLGAYHKAVSAQQTQQAAAAAKQQAINNVNSKQHLKSGAPQGGGMEAVPAAELRYFRTFMPDASESDIQRYYNQYKKQEARR